MQLAPATSVIGVLASGVNARTLVAGAVLCGALVAQHLQAQAVPASAQAAQQRATLPGFNVSFTPPAGWQRAASEGRMEAWMQSSTSSVIFLFAGAFSPIQLAVADAGGVLDELPEQEPEMIESLAERRFGAHAGVSSTFRARGADGSTVIVRIAAVSLGGVSTLGAVAIVPAAQHESRLATFESLDAVLAGARGGAEVADQALTRQLTGSWQKQSAYNSGPSGGGYIDEERWALGADGRFSHQKTFAVSVPGVAVTPTREEQTGRWRAVGGALVLEADGETMTVSITPDGQALRIGSARYIRR